MDKQKVIFGLLNASKLPNKAAVKSVKKSSESILIATWSIEIGRKKFVISDLKRRKLNQNQEFGSNCQIPSNFLLSFER